MFRPGGFPEYNPQEQKIFDTIIHILQHTFEQSNYQHIRTPAVEPVDILMRGWDIADKQVYGLFGLAQWPQDVKDYALHFDLTIPLARYVLDHRHELTFPFRRYQIQPVWRGERTKRWRFKEFWQCDIDAVRPSIQDVWVRYDIESVAILSQAMKAVSEQLNIQIDSVLKISHLAVTKAFLEYEWVWEENIPKILSLLDNYFKITPEEFWQKTQPLMSTSVYKKLEQIITTHDYTLLSHIPWYSQLEAIMNWLKVLWIDTEYDICIVRGHNYYKGMVCERFERNDIALGSLAGGGRYDQITDFIDRKQSFSWVWTSLWRFIPLAIQRVIESQQIQQSETYLFAHFDDTREHTIWLYQKFIQAGKICECYPTATKLWKQFEYADKKWISHVVIYGSQEVETKSFIIKNLATWEQKTVYLEYSYGIIPTRDTQEWKELLLAKSVYWHRSFPKWHIEPWESWIETAMRECKEETNLTPTAFLSHSHERISQPNQAISIDEVFFKVSDGNLKTVTYYIAQISGQESHQVEEITELRRIWSKHAHTLATYPETKQLAQRVARLLK